jgi:Ser-tRNA(Ala) deacylase AlaX
MGKRMPLNDQPDACQTYLVCLWRVQCQGKWQWRASVKSPHTGERQVFASLEQLFAYLTEQCDRQMPAMTETRGT